MTHKTIANTIACVRRWLALCLLALAPFGVDAAGAVGAALVYGLYGLVQGGAGALAFGLGATRDNHP